MNPFEQMDGDILIDFVTESNELIEALDQDLVTLEHQPNDTELMNSIFRALHTIKGSSSFLGLDPLTEFAHATEDALNSLRKGETPLTTELMDMLLQAADIVRNQLDCVDQKIMPEPGPSDLIAKLKLIGSGGDKQAPTKKNNAESKETEDNQNKLTLSESKRELFPYMVDDLSESLNELAEIICQLQAGDSQPAQAVRIADLTEELLRSVGFFEIDELTHEVQAIYRIYDVFGQLKAEVLQQLIPRSLALIAILQQRAEALVDLILTPINTETTLQHIETLLDGQSLPDNAQLPKNADAQAALQIDGIIDAQSDATKQTAASTDPPSNTGNTQSQNNKSKEQANTPSQGERTIRVDVDRLENLLNLVGELVLQKNRVLGLGRKLTNENVTNELTEDVTQVGCDLDRVTADLQMSIMKTRMQPMSKLFNRYPRMLRDLARNTGKKIDLNITGADTEVDKSVIESLGDPLVHILRNSADHGLEMPEDRTKAGKSDTGTIEISARYEGNHVLVEIRDDGHGIDPQKVGRKAVEKGLISEETMESMPDGELIKLIFAPGFSMAEKVSDLSGRGVGMDVVRTNITKLNGLVDMKSTLNEGTTVSIRIPLTVAIMQAMVVGVGDVLYALPLSNILEIRRPEESQTSQIGGQTMLRLREEVIPLIDMAQTFEYKNHEKSPTIAVIVGLGEQRLGLLVDELVGQQEIVIKPLDEMFDRSGLISGATVREDGGVNLILDITAVFTKVNQEIRNAA